MTVHLPQPYEPLLVGWIAGVQVERGGQQGRQPQDDREDRGRMGGQREDGDNDGHHIATPSWVEQWGGETTGDGDHHHYHHCEHLLAGWVRE
jgi:hypothetical protein